VGGGSAGRGHLPGLVSRPRNDLYSVEWDVKPLLTHSLAGWSAPGARSCLGFTSEGHCPKAPSYLSSCKISAKSSNARPNYSDLTN